jgi:hypothetical protein
MGLPYLRLQPNSPPQRTLGLTIPPTMLALATTVIE